MEIFSLEFYFLVAMAIMFLVCERYQNVNWFHGFWIIVIPLFGIPAINETNAIPIALLLIFSTFYNLLHLANNGVKKHV